MICALIRDWPTAHRQAEWQEFLELLASLALFGQPLTVLVLPSGSVPASAAGNAAGVSLPMLQDLGAQLHSPASPAAEGCQPADHNQVRALLHRADHCMVF